MIVGFGHKAQSGKDTCADYLVKNYGYKRIGFADALKETCSVAFGVPIEMFYGENKIKVDPYWNMTYRKMLQYIGTDLFRNQVDMEFWVKRAFKSVNSSSRVVFSDMRFPNEVAMIQQKGGLAIEVERDLELRMKMLDESFDFNHKSETALDNYRFWDDHIVNNFTLDELYECLDNIMEDHGIERV